MHSKVFRSLVVFTFLTFWSGVVGTETYAEDGPWAGTEGRWKIESDTHRYWRPHNPFFLAKIVKGKKVEQVLEDKRFNNKTIESFADLKSVELIYENKRTYWEVHFRSEGQTEGEGIPKVHQWVARMDSLGISEVKGNFDYLPMLSKNLETFISIANIGVAPYVEDRVTAKEIKAAGPKNKTLRPLPADDPLSSLGRDLTLANSRSESVRLIGRDKEVARVIRRLSGKKTSAAIITGEAASGKTAIANEIARRIMYEPEKVPAKLRNHRIVSVNLGALKSQEGNEQTSHMNQVFNGVLESAANPVDGRPVILFFKNIHNLVGAGASKGDTHGLEEDLLTFMPEHPSLKILGTSTTHAYHKHFRLNQSLKDLFGPNSIHLKQFKTKQTLKALKSHRATIENDYGVTISDKALKHALRLSDEYLAGRGLAGALSLLDTAAQLVNEAIELGQISATDNAIRLKTLEHAVREETNIPTVGKGFRKTILNLSKSIRTRVYSQRHVADAVQNAYTRRFINQEVKGAIGSFLFVGDTGTGKTELAKAIAEIITGDERNLIRINLSEVADINQIIGDRDNLGLIHEVAANPFSVLLLDEIDRAPKKIRDLFFTAADEGIMRDFNGVEVSFRNTYIAATTNAGMTDAGTKEKNPFGFGNNVPDVQTQGNESLREKFDRAFLARFDPYVFNKLDDKARHSIAEARINQLIKTYSTRHKLKLKVSEGAYRYIVENAPREENGRSIKKFVNKHIDAVLAAELLRYQHKTTKKDKGTIHVTTKENSDGTARLSFTYPERVKDYFAHQSKSDALTARDRRHGRFAPQHNSKQKNKVARHKKR